MMTNFEHMKEIVLETVEAMDEEELMQLCSDACMDEHLKGVWNCNICERNYDECPSGLNKGCTDRYKKWCKKEYNPQPEEDKKDIVDKLQVLLQATRAGEGIDNMHLSEDNKMVIIKYKNGTLSHVNIECDSGYAIIKDVLAAL